MIKEVKSRYFVAKRDKISKRIDRFLAQFEEGRASTITFIEFIHEQFLNFGCKNKQKGQLKELEEQTKKACECTYMRDIYWVL